MKYWSQHGAELPTALESDQTHWADRGTCPPGLMQSRKIPRGLFWQCGLVQRVGGFRSMVESPASTVSYIAAKTGELMVKVCKMIRRDWAD